MATRTCIVAALLAAFPIPAAAGVISIGSSNARLCYEAADSMILPTPRTLERCNEALAEPGVSRRDVVATYVNRGILKLRRGQIDAAIADFDAASALDPNQPEAYLNKGAALIQRNNVREALPLFTIALEHNTNRPAMAHLGRAIANETLGDIQAAYRDYRRAAELEPDWEQPRAELARFQVTPR